MKIKLNVLMSIAILLLSGCSDGPYEDYIGYWLGVDQFGVVEIAGSGDKLTFQHRRASVGETDGKKVKLVAGTDGLYVDNRHHNVWPVKLIDGGFSLMLMDRKYSRITEEEFKQVQKTNGL